MDDRDRTRAAWDAASQKYEREHRALLDEAATVRLLPVEEALLQGRVVGARVLHPLSGHGLDDLAMARLGARHVLGLDAAPAAVRSAQARADALGPPCDYRLAEIPPLDVDDGSADLVSTGRGALIWIADLRALLAEVRRVLRPGGALVVLESHPLVPLLTWEPGRIGVRSDRSCFQRRFENDTFPAGGAIEVQRTLAEIVTDVLGAGLTIEHLEEHPEPFWKPDGAVAAAWDGRLPNTFSLLAVRPPDLPHRDDRS